MVIGPAALYSRSCMHACTAVRPCYTCMHTPPGTPPSIFYAEPRALDNTRFMRDGGHWEDAHFVAHFRMRKAHFFHLASLLEPVLQGGSSNFKEAIGVPVKLAVGLAKLTNEAITYRAIHLMFGLARSTACKVVHQVVYAINDVMRTEFLPRLNQNTAGPVKAAFQRKGFPNCMGAIDGTHFKILKPNVPASDDYFCQRKNSHTIQMQAVCDHRMFFWDVVIGRPGSMHDARVLKLSNLYQNANTAILGCGPEAQLATGVSIAPYVLGDGGYANLPWLISPIPTPRAAPLAHNLLRWNTHHSSARMVIERAFGRLKGRFRCLQGTLHYDLPFLPEVVMACVLLHNFLIVKNDDLDVEEAGANLGPDVQDIAHGLVGAGLHNDMSLGRQKRQRLIDHYFHP
jgi:hypothetical protein